MYNFNNYDYISPMETTVVLGCFDGMHAGHQAVFEKAKRESEKRGLSLLAYVFEEPPKKFFAPDEIKIISSPDEKRNLIRKIGVDTLVMTKFDEAIAGISDIDFVKKILSENLKARCVVCGENYTFGKGGEADTGRLKELCGKYGIDVIAVPPVRFGDTEISSTLIRKTISEGDVVLAAEYMGRPASITGTVVIGNKIGEKIGIPTANILPNPNYAVPADGVYISKVIIGAKRYFSVTDIGVRPTVNGRQRRTETHIINFGEQLYGKKITVSFCKFLRPEIKFNSLDELKNQIEIDIYEAQKYHKKH